MTARVHCDSYLCKNVKPLQNAVWVSVQLRLFDRADTYLRGQIPSADCCSWRCLIRLIEEQIESSPACRAYEHGSCSEDACTCMCHIDFHCHQQDEHDQCTGQVEHTEDGDKWNGGLGHGRCHCDCHIPAGVRS